MAKAPPREDPAELITKAIANNRAGWIGKLNEEDQKYVNDVINEAIIRPDVPAESVARALKAELGISTAIGTISRTIRERMINHHEE